MSTLKIVRGVIRQAGAENWQPWRVINELEIAICDEDDIWDNVISETVLSIYLMKYCSSKKDRFMNGKKFYELELIPRNYWGYDDHPTKKSVGHLKSKYIAKYIEMMVELIAEDYENKKKRYPLVIYLADRAESHPPWEFKATFLNVLTLKLMKKWKLMVYKSIEDIQDTLENDTVYIETN